MELLLREIGLSKATFTVQLILSTVQSPWQSLKEQLDVQVEKRRVPIAVQVVWIELFNDQNNNVRNFMRRFSYIEPYLSPYQRFGGGDESASRRWIVDMELRQSRVIDANLTNNFLLFNAIQGESLDDLLAAVAYGPKLSGRVKTRPGVDFTPTEHLNIPELTRRLQAFQLTFSIVMRIYTHAGKISW